MKGPMRIHLGPLPAQNLPLLWTIAWPSRAEELADRTNLVTEQLLAVVPMSAADVPWLRLCLDEILANAVIHGNQADPVLPYTVTLWANSEEWRLAVADEGVGFTLGAIPDPQDPGSLLLEHGRGIRILVDWLDDLTYYGGGSIALLSRRIHHDLHPT